MSTPRDRLFLHVCAYLLVACASGTDTDTDVDEDPSRPAEDAGTGSGPDAGSGLDGGEPPLPDAGSRDGGPEGPGGDSGPTGEDAGPAGPDGGSVEDGGTPEPCTTRVTYGSAWIRGDRQTDFDLVNGDVRWDGVCTNEGPNSFAVLSNGWKPYFSGHNACIIALDHSGDCADVDAQCTTRVTYGESWNAPPGRTTRTDRVTGRVTWNGGCTNSGSESYATLSNGWVPHFRGNGACNMGFAYSECGGLYTNDVMGNCADPGVMKVGDTYYAACTGGGPNGAFAMHTSKDLVHWESSGRVFPQGKVPTWGKDRFWAPEPHRVGDHYVVYFSAGDHSGRMGIGAAYSDDPAGPYTDIGQPFIYDTRISLIDASYFEDASGQGYVMWKTDGNAQGEPCVVYAQRVSRDGLTRLGSPVELLRNDLGWEGTVVEGSWIIRHDGYYYLFYSGNAYYNDTYGVGVARATSPLGPYVKKGNPIVSTNARWVGPGHCSVVEGPSGGWQMVYHAWRAGEVGGGYQRKGMIDPVQFADGWPIMREIPSMRSAPRP